MSNKMNLMLHCGAEQIDRDSELMTRVPHSQGLRHAPIPHQTFVKQVEDIATHAGLVIRNEAFGALKDGSRFFGLMEVGSKQSLLSTEDYTTVIGMRGSHDRSISAGLVAGSGVFVCDNLCFSGEVKIATKQTTHLLDRLPTLVYDAIGKVVELAELQADRFKYYKGAHLTNHQADAAITGLVRIGAINPSQVGQVIEEYDEPSYEEFAQEKNVWRLHNAVTEIYKPSTNKDGEAGRTQMQVLPQRSIQLTRACDMLSNVENAAYMG
ncbi:MAG: DUF945 domain-containing protein [Planctomycetes bacterium]|nr:DUF945 domain-containing protein [Planctomycetota bacterium]